MAVQRFHPGQITGGILLSLMALVAPGCYEEIAYDPSADVPAASSRPSTAAAPDASAPNVELPLPESESAATTPVEAPPTDRYARADAASEVAPAPSDPSIEPDLFGEEVSPPQPAHAVPTAAPATQASPSGGAILPWDDEAPREPTDVTEPPAQLPSDAAPAPAARAGGVFPWDEPAEPVAPEEPPPAAAEIEPSPTPERVPSPPFVAPSLPDAEAELQPARQSPVTSRHAAWLLGSKLSFAILAPEEEASRVVPELQPLAHLLGVELVVLDYDQLRGTPAGMTRLLSVGRDLGEQLAARHDSSHAALVEVALKSNLLLAVHAERPHLAHSIGGAVAAACVRAGIPEDIWQPWQDTLAAGGSTDEVMSAVIALHHQIDTFLQNPPNEAAEAVLR